MLRNLTLVPHHNLEVVVKPSVHFLSHTELISILRLMLDRIQCVETGKYIPVVKQRLREHEILIFKIPNWLLSK